MLVADVISLIHMVDRLIDLENRMARLGTTQIRSDSPSTVLTDAEHLEAVEQIIIPIELGQVTAELIRLMDALETAGKEVRP